MRLWHVDLIPVLPKSQLIGQWQDCCLIARNIFTHGIPNHILVNVVSKYPSSHLLKYAYMVRKEMLRRGFKCDETKIQKWIPGWEELSLPEPYELFQYWHNHRYLKQCYYNLQEKYDRGGMSDAEWKLIEDRYKGYNE